MRLLLLCAEKEGLPADHADGPWGLDKGEGHDQKWV